MDEQQQKQMSVEDYLRQKFMDAGIGDDERAKYQAEVDAAKPAGWRKALMAAGAALQGGNAGAAVDSLYGDQKMAQKKLYDFDKRKEDVRRQAVQDYLMAKQDRQRSEDIQYRQKRDQIDDERWNKEFGRKQSAGPKAPSGYRYNESGDLEPIPGGPADKPKSGPQDDWDKLDQKSYHDQHLSLRKGAQGADEKIGLIDDALTDLGKYSRGSWTGGTGPLATLGGKLAFSDDTQSLNSKFKKLALKDMTQMFAGMSKAVDSEAERRAFEATQPSLANDDDVNAEILLGSKAIALKGQKELEAQKQYIAQHGRLDQNYESPIIGRTTAVVHPETGKMEIIPKDRAKDAMAQGYMPIDQYAKILVGDTKAPTKPTQQKMTPQQPGRPSPLMSQEERDELAELRRLRDQGGMANASK